MHEAPGPSDRLRTPPHGPLLRMPTDRNLTRELWYDCGPAVFCRNCQATGWMWVRLAMTVDQPQGSLAGMQPKVTARYWPWTGCRACGAVEKGKVNQ